MNYYEELGLNSEMSIEEISEKLTQLETVWNQRLFNEPEKANKALIFIKEAREKFATIESKAEYDITLQNKDDKKDDAALSAYNKAKADAESFISNEQWDLAKNAIDKALLNVESVVVDDEEKADMYELARRIYYNNGLFSQAVDFSNKSIELSPDSAIYYAKKAISLSELDTQMRNSGQDASRVFQNYQTTCKIWIEKAKLENNDKLASMGLDALARSYLDAREYVLMEKYASEAVALDPENTGAQQVLYFLERTREVDLSELQAYYFETSPYEEEIMDLANQIASSGITPPTPEGWVLYEALSYMEDDKPYGQYEQHENVSIVLTTNGKFKKIVKLEYGDNPYKVGHDRYNARSIKKETEVQDYYLNSTMQAMDFKADFYKGNDDDPGYHFEHTTDVLSVSTDWERGHLIRYGSIKGKRLYSFLKNIVDQAAEQIEKQKKYEEECSRINVAYNAEYEPLREKIVDEFASRKEALQKEQNIAIENAKQQEVQMSSIQTRIATLRKELSSLGFFAGKKKREIQDNIDNLERSLKGLTTVGSVTGLYTKKFAELDQHERNAIVQLEIELRAKYPLPSKN